VSVVLVGNRRAERVLASSSVRRAVRPVGPATALEETELTEPLFELASEESEDEEQHPSVQ
jgi:hypothetical protein